jgi:hypothetical protein
MKRVLSTYIYKHISVHIFVLYTYSHMYIHTHTHVCVCVYMYTYYLDIYTQRIYTHIRTLDGNQKSQCEVFYSHVTCYVVRQDSQGALKHTQFLGQAQFFFVLIA